MSTQFHIPNHFTLQQERMVPSGQKAKRALQRREFLCSSENWSGPTCRSLGTTLTELHQLFLDPKSVFYDAQIYSPANLLLIIITTIIFTQIIYYLNTD